MIGEKTIANIMIFSLLVAGSCSGVELVREGKPCAKIMVADNAGRMVQYAAEELQTYVKKATGATLPIEKALSSAPAAMNETENYIFVGESAYTKKLGIRNDDLKPDGFRIISKDNYLAIIGKDYGGPTLGTVKRGTDWSYEPQNKISMYGEAGTLFGVYHFLEKFCGVRWFMPGEIGETVPKIAALDIPKTNINEAPYIDYRELMAYYIFGNDKESAVWYRRACFGGTYALSLNHSFDLFDGWAKEHPEYFYLDAGGKPDKHLYLCLTEPAVINAVVEYIRKYFNEHPDVKMFPLVPKDYPVIPDIPDEQMTDARFKGWRNDALGGNGRGSDYLFTFVGKVAGELQKTHPDRQIGCLAYNMYLLPPPTVKKLPSNTAIMICMMTADHANEKERAWFYDLVKEWHRRCKNIYFWDYADHYYVGEALPSMPIVYTHTIAKEFKELKKMLGTDWKGIYFEAESGRPQFDAFINREMQHLTFYAFGRCLWNPDLDIDALLNDYYGSFFGPAKEEMRKYYDLAEKLFSEKIQKHAFTGHYYNSGFVMDYTPEETDALLGYLKSAKQKAGDSIYGKRVDLILENVSKLKKRFAVTSQYDCVPLGPTEGVGQTNGLAAYWRFDEGEGNITKDSSGNNNDGIIHNAKWLKTPIGAALEFNGKDSYVEIRPQGKTLQPEKAVTIMGWFYFARDLKGKFGLVWTKNYAYLFHGNMDHLILLTIYNDKKGRNLNFGFVPLHLYIPGWNHITGTYDGSKMKIYLNGELLNEASFSGNIGYQGDGGKFTEFGLEIGRRSDAKSLNLKSADGTGYFKGRIDEVKIYNRALGDDEVKAEYKKGEDTFSKNKE